METGPSPSLPLPKTGSAHRRSPAFPHRTTNRKRSLLRLVSTFGTSDHVALGVTDTEVSVTCVVVIQMPRCPRCYPSPAPGTARLAAVDDGLPQQAQPLVLYPYPRRAADSMTQTATIAGGRFRRTNAASTLGGGDDRMTVVQAWHHLVGEFDTVALMQVNAGRPSATAQTVPGPRGRASAAAPRQGHPVPARRATGRRGAGPVPVGRTPMHPLDSCARPSPAPPQAPRWSVADALRTCHRR
jgi:hypothetical protein